MSFNENCLNLSGSEHLTTAFQHLQIVSFSIDLQQVYLANLSFFTPTIQRFKLDSFCST